MTKLGPPQQSSQREMERGDDRDSYRIGYKKPPLHSRFKKGTSGNPRGRKKQVEGRDIRQSVLQAFLREITIREGDQARNVPKIVALIECVLTDALRGDAKAKILAYSIANQLGVLTFKDEIKFNLDALSPEEKDHVDKSLEILRSNSEVMKSA